jgi:hypothetical protein
MRRMLAIHSQQQLTFIKPKYNSMKIVKRILLGIAGFVVLLLIAALFVRNEYKVEKTVAISKPKEDVFNYVKFARNQDHFNKWIMTDPQIKKTYKGDDGTVGFVYAWDSEGSAGKGEQEISSIRPSEQVNFAVRFLEPFEGSADTYMKTEALDANQTKLTWHMEGRNRYPMNLMNLFVSGMLGDDMTTSLTTLKTVLEKQ